VKILVIDDAEHNRASARMTLADHDVTVIDNVLEAFKVLDVRRMQFDAVLTDLMMPIGLFRGAMSKTAVPPRVGVPAGLVFAIKASNLGIRSVICADSNHHHDWICALLDLLVDKHGSHGRRISDHAKQVAFVELGTVAMLATWDAQNKIIVLDENCWKKDVPRIKHWREAMVESGIFPEIKQTHVHQMQEAS